MGFARTTDWRKQPVEIRERMLDELKLRASSTSATYRDPIELAKACGITPDEWQRDLLLSSEKQIVMNCSRQSGKSTTTALLALHEAAYKDDSLVLVLSPSQRQSQETYRKIRSFYNELGDLPDVVQESALKLELGNGSRVQVLPGKEDTIRGFSGVALLIVDEASRVKDDIYQAVRPMIAVSGGRIVLLSTPFGARGFFWKEWIEGGGDWKRVKVTAEQCPRIPKKWLEKERQRIGDWWFKQEYLCTFVDSLEAVFSTADIEAAITDEVTPIWQM